MSLFDFKLHFSGRGQEAAAARKVDCYPP
jgi:hypothetical protein